VDHKITGYEDCQDSQDNRIDTRDSQITDQGIAKGLHSLVATKGPADFPWFLGDPRIWD